MGVNAAQEIRVDACIRRSTIQIFNPCPHKTDPNGTDTQKSIGQNSRRGTLYWFSARIFDDLTISMQVEGVASGGRTNVTKTAQWWFNCSELLDNFALHPSLFYRLQSAIRSTREIKRTCSPERQHPALLDLRMNYSLERTYQRPLRGTLDKVYDSSTNTQRG